MEYITICFVALLASALTFFSGFGLGTILTPAFVWFFPVEAAIAMTAVVHFSNNLFKLLLIGRHTRIDIVLWFGVPAILAAIAGAMALNALAALPALGSYQFAGNTFHIEAVKLVVAVLMLLFAIWEVAPGLKDMSLDPRWLPAGGILSGFLGGLSGHQGALRSVFLLKCRLTKESFIATGVSIAILIDAARITVYATESPIADWSRSLPLMIAAVLAAFVGALVGRMLLPKVTFTTVRWTVAVLLSIIAVLLGLGIV